MTRNMLVGFIVILGSAAVMSGDDSGTGRKEPDAPFATPLVAFTLMSDAEDLVLLKDVRERMLGDRKFLVGEGVDDGETPDWRNNRRVWVAVEDVQQAVEFDSVESFRKSVETKREGGTKAASAKYIRPAPHRIVKPLLKKS